MAWCNNEPNMFTPVRKEDCINHVKKRIETALHPGLTQDLAKKADQLLWPSTANSAEANEIERGGDALGNRRAFCAPP